MRPCAHRRGNGVRQGTITSDIAALKIALNFATDHKRDDGSALIEFNPLARVTVERERNPRRPVADVDRYQKLKDVAHHLPPAFGLALDLVRETGHRIGGVLGLRWADVILDPVEAARLAYELDPDVGWTAAHFPDGGIRWYEGHRSDNKKYDHVAVMTVFAREALDAARPTPGSSLRRRTRRSPSATTSPRTGWSERRRWPSFRTSRAGSGTPSGDGGRPTASTSPKGTLPWRVGGGTLRR